MFCLWWRAKFAKRSPSNLIRVSPKHTRLKPPLSMVKKDQESTIESKLTNRDHHPIGRFENNNYLKPPARSSWLSYTRTVSLFTWSTLNILIYIYNYIRIYIYITFYHDPLPTWYPLVLTTSVPGVVFALCHSSTDFFESTNELCVKLSRFLWFWCQAIYTWKRHMLPIIESWSHEEQLWRLNCSWVIIWLVSTNQALGFWAPHPRTFLVAKCDPSLAPQV